jgi:hypothetical protein
MALPYNFGSGTLPADANFMNQLQIDLTLLSSFGGSPGSRLTLTSGTPVMTASVPNATTVFYTGGTTELHQDTTDTSKSPGAVGVSLNYDMFAWLDGSTARCTRGPDWTVGGGSAVVRGTGAGSTALTRNNGILVNANAITNGPAALQGYYVGTIRSNTSSKIDFIYGGAASGGVAAVLNVWNMYNRVSIGTTVTDSGGNYTYTSSTVRQARAAATNQISFVLGLQEDMVDITYVTNLATVAAAAFATASIGLDSLTVFSTQASEWFDSAGTVQLGQMTRHLFSGLGSHFAAPLEASDNTNANTFNTNNSNRFAACLRM